ncbi:CD63 antigen-like [Nilaparvata lugens]|uniref:CD63 antigen-like n=1 Tax=Nilaparvata lugens TaxID=108931 RepID=UPI000B99D058|nr:CD63 antigen-like [Nilaparvata lugens]XP_039292408.1 CD63 antigen-like [Nilaparvata lugens]
METCSMSVIKYLLFFFNLIFALSGLVLIIVGVMVLLDVGEFSHFLESKVLAPPIVMIVAGCIVFLIAFLGCCGAIKESYSMLIAFAVLLLVIFIVEMAVGIAAGMAKDEFSNAMRSSLKKSLNNYTINDEDRKAWDTVQRKLQCCGVDGPRGWLTVFPNNNVPGSCCREPPASANAFCRNTLDDKIIFQDGCYQKLKNKVKDNIVLIMGVGIGIAFIELAGIVLACCLASAIKKEEELKQVTVLRVWNEIEEDNKRWREMEEERLRNQKKVST